MNVFRRKPATHACLLQGGVGVTGKGLILAGIADKAEVILDRPRGEGCDVVDEGIRHASPPEEDLRDFAARAVDGVDAAFAP
jgi:hypothetical protein